MYRRHSPVRNQRSKGIKIKHVVQLCLLIAVCFWLIFQVKRSHDNKKQFDSKLSNAATDEILRFGRKDLHPKLEETTTTTTTATQEQDDDDDETKHEEEEQDEDKIEDGDDEIDEKSSMEIDPDEVDIIDEDKETEEEKDGRSQTDDGSTEHTHEAREEHYKADDASSAVITHDPDTDVKNATLDVVNSSDIIGNSENETVQEKDFDKNATASVDLEYRENGPPANTTSTSTGSSATVTETTQVLTQNSEMLKSNGEENASDKSKSENLDSGDPTHLEEKQVRNDLETLPEIETEAAAE